MIETTPELKDQPISVIFVDDDEGLRELVKILLGFEPYINLVGAASTGTAGVELVKELKPDVLMVDYRLPDIDGLEVCNQVSAAIPEVQLLVVSGYASAEVAGSLKMAGFTYVEKTQAFADLAGLLRRIAALRDHPVVEEE